MINRKVRDKYKKKILKMNRKLTFSHSEDWLIFTTVCISNSVKL